jgi:D-glycero-alpha-D-manno-heptose-7-phosphate kinase
VSRVITAVAPVRICDCGGWTDTWFAGHGSVFNIAVSPFVCVRVSASIAARPGRIIVHAANLDLSFEPAGAPPWRAHPLIEAAVASVEMPTDRQIEIVIRSDVPPGASTGTSAALTVALLGALGQLVGGDIRTAAVARMAHTVETERLGRQCGIQDQIAAAHGGINFIDVHAYPEATVTPVPLAARTRQSLGDRLLLVYLGRSHDSSDVHRRVIARLESSGGANASLDALRDSATAARDAVTAGDLRALGRAMCSNTEAQSRLDPALVGESARAVIDLARTHQAWGWKVNGAGGEGGSISLLAGERNRQDLIRAVERAGAGWRVIPTRLADHGLRVVEDSFERGSTSERNERPA